MSAKHNEPESTDPATMACRGAVEHRTAWITLLYEQAKKQGTDAEKVCREAIRKHGHIHGNNMYKPLCGDPNSAADFGRAFFSGQGTKNMEIDVPESSHDSLVAGFRQCPLIQAWERLGYKSRELKLLRDMAMDGDRGITDQMGLILDITKTIAAGDGCCHLHSHKRFVSIQILYREPATRFSGCHFHMAAFCDSGEYLHNTSDTPTS